MSTISVPGSGVAVTEVFTNIGGAVQGDIMRANGAGILATASNDTLANASKIRGVWNGSRLCRTGEVALVNFADQPVIDTDCYLSGTAKLATMTAPTASVVPRKIGRVTQVLSASQALVELSIDEDRDNNRLWLVETYAPSVSAQSKTFTLNPALWSTLEFRGAQIGKVDGASIIELRADHAQSGASYGHATGGGASGNSGIQSYAYSVLTNMTKLDNGAYSYMVARLFKVAGGLWKYDSHGGGHEASVSTLARGGTYTGTLGTVTTDIQLYGTVADVFQGNIAKVELWAKVL